MKPKPCSEFFIASCTPDGGAFRYRLFDDETAEAIQRISMPSPMYLHCEGERLWAVLRAPFANSKESGVTAVHVSTGRPITELCSTMGEVACHLAVDQNEVFCANYLSGSVFRAPDRRKLHQGKGTDPERQDSPHVHSVVLSPDKRFLLACDLGLDTVFVYDRDLNLLSTQKVPAGAGARHAVFSKDGAFVYVINEMGGSISIFSHQDGRLEYEDTLSLCSESSSKASGAAIKLSEDGRRLYVTERASQSIFTLSVQGEKLKILSRTDSHGREPRDFTLLAKERFAVCTNQFDDTVALFRMSPEGIPSFVKTIGIAAPLCAVEIRSYDSD